VVGAEAEGGEQSCGGGLAGNFRLAAVLHLHPRAVRQLAVELRRRPRGVGDQEPACDLLNVRRAGVEDTGRERCAEHRCPGERICPESLEAVVAIDGSGGAGRGNSPRADGPEERSCPAHQAYR
jgi:hypothetical protein